MRWINGDSRSFFGLRAFLLGLFVALLASSTTAQEYIPNGSPIPQGIRYVNTTATGVNTSATFSSVFNGVSRSHTMPVPVSTGTLGSLAKGALRGAGRVAGPLGWLMAMKDIINGAGWVINELQQQVVVPGTPQQPLEGSVYCANAPDFGMQGSYCASTAQAVCDYLMGKFFAGQNQNPVNHCRMSSSGTTLLACNAGGGCSPIGGPLSVPNPVTNVNPYREEVPVTDTQLGDLVKARPEIINAVLVDPVTGAPIRTPELVKAMNDLRKALEAAHGTPP